METLEFKLASQPIAAAPPTLCGVVGSGNLEVLVQPGTSDETCSISVNTSAVGFRDTWAAVLEDFARRHPVGRTRIIINDMGATPAVVTLRLEQALRAYVGGAR